MTEAPVVAEPTSTCGVCRVTDSEPKHQILVGFSNQHTKGAMFHEHDFERDGTIFYHFGCPTPWHDLHTVLSTVAVPSDDPNDPGKAWTEDSAAKHRQVANNHALICEEARKGTSGDALRAFINEVTNLPQVRGGAGGIDQTMATAILAALAKNSSTATLGTVTYTGPLNMRLMTANGSDSSNGTQLGAGGGYSTGGTTVSMGTASAGSVASNGAASWTNMPSCTLTGMEEWDSSGTPLRCFWAPWTVGNIVVASGNTFTVASGSLTNTLS
jgi:hypothetical protein